MNHHVLITDILLNAQKQTQNVSRQTVEQGLSQIEDQLNVDITVDRLILFFLFILRRICVPI